MTQTTARAGEAGGQPLADLRQRSAAALDSADELLRAHQGGPESGDDARLAISRSLSEALRDLASLQAAAEPGSDEARRARDGLKRFDKLLSQIAQAGLLPER